MPPDRDWLDFVSLTLEVITLLVTGVGLAFVVFSLRKGAEQQRTEAGPYVRVDVGADDVDSDFLPPDPYYRNGTHSIDLASGLSDEETVTLAAWLRNYQNHPLGMAIAVTVSFLVEVNGVEPILNQVRVAYLEHEKPVRVDLVRIRRDAAADVTIVSLSFLDFYDHRHEHRYGSRGTNALHGRLRCRYEAGRVQAVPEGRSRGKGVELEE